MLQLTTAVSKAALPSMAGPNPAMTSNGVQNSATSMWNSFTSMLPAAIQSYAGFGVVVAAGTAVWFGWKRFRKSGHPHM